MGSYGGIDWASEKHDVLIADEHGGQLLAETFMHDEQGIVALCDALSCFEVDVVAIERGDGVLVERLLEVGVRVLALHPNQVKAARDRFRASGGKSDRFDSFVLCELARTSRRCGSQALEQLRRRLARIAVRLQEGGHPLLIQPMCVGPAGIAGQERERDRAIERGEQADRSRPEPLELRA